MACSVLKPVRVVDGDYVVVDHDGVATVVQDELQNACQFAGTAGE